MLRLLFYPPRSPRSFLMLVFCLVWIWSRVSLATGLERDNEDIFKQIEHYVVGQPSPVTAYDVAAQFAFVADDPAYGTAAQFSSSSPQWIRVAALSSTHFVVAYNRSLGRAIVGEVSGTSITYGSESTFNAASVSNLSVAALSSTHFVVVYSDTQVNNAGTAIVGSVSGTTITYGTENTFHGTQSTWQHSVGALSADKFVVAYIDQQNSSHGTAIIGNVSGTTISDYGSEHVFNAASISAPSIAVLSSTHFAVAYSDGGNSFQGTAIVGSVSGTAITYGAENVFNAASTFTLSATALSSTHFVVAYVDGGNSSHGTAITGSVSGITISGYGSESVFNATNTGSLGVAALDAATFIVGYYDGEFDDVCTSGSCDFQSRVGDVSGTTISAYSNEVQVDASLGSGSSNTIAVANMGTFVVAYRDIGDNTGQARYSSTPTSLPVELTHFNARTDGNHVSLYWSTASETNNAGFEIQAQAVPAAEQTPQAALANWKPLTFVSGYGTTVEAQAYSHRFTDFEPGVYRFRLKQVDFNGTFAYSPITEVTVALPEQYVLSATYPNPFNAETQFTLSVQQQQVVRVGVYDVLGRIEQTLYVGVLSANYVHTFRFDATGKPSGWYQVRIEGETFHTSERVLLLK